MIEQLDNMKINKDLATLRLKKREDFWIEILKTLHANGLNAELNFLTNNQKSLYLLSWYMSTNVIFSADGILTSLDVNFKYMTSNYTVTQLVQISNILLRTVEEILRFY